MKRDQVRKSRSRNLIKRFDQQSLIRSIDLSLDHDLKLDLDLDLSLQGARFALLHRSFCCKGLKMHLQLLCLIYFDSGISVLPGMRDCMS